MNKKNVKKSLFKSRGNKCHYCNCELTHETATIEHIVPKFLGGSNKLSNLALSCGPCNHSKGWNDGEAFTKKSDIETVKFCIKRSGLKFLEMCELLVKACSGEIPHKKLTKVRRLYLIPLRGRNYSCVFNVKNNRFEDIWRES